MERSKKLNIIPAKHPNSFVSSLWTLDLDLDLRLGLDLDLGSGSGSPNLVLPGFGILGAGKVTQDFPVCFLSSLGLPGAPWWGSRA